MGQTGGSVAVHAIADDLSGAAEVAALLTPRTWTAVLTLSAPPAAPVSVSDLDLRHANAGAIGPRVRAALRATPGARVLVKTDSLLRGPLPSVLEAAWPAVLAPALPVLNRVVIDGRPVVDGGRLADTSAWTTEGRPAPASVMAAVAPLPGVSIPLATVRSPRLAGELAEAIEHGRLPICDGVTDADLDRVVSATATLPGVALAGAGALASALGRWLGEAPAPEADAGGREPGPSSPSAGPLIVVGTADAHAAEQVARLAGAGVRVLDLPHAGLLRLEDGLPATVRGALRDGPLVLRPDRAEPVDPNRSRRLVAGLAELVATALTEPTAPTELVPLALTGGETARRVLDALGVRTLRPVGSVHHGAVISHTDDGRRVITRPGSFGGPDSLVAVLDALRPPPSPGAPTTIPFPPPPHHPFFHHLPATTHP